MVSYKALNTLREAITPKTRNAIWNGDGSKAITAREAVFPQTRNAIWNGDGSKAKTGPEAIVP